MTAQQCREARTLLGWTRESLAQAVRCSRDTVSYAEAGTGRPKPRTLAAIRSALEAAGVEFTNGEAPGVRLRATKAG